MSKALSNALAYIEKCDDPALLDRMARNAAAKGEHEVQRAAQLRRYELMPAAAPGTLEYDVWQSIHALEDQLSNERDRTTRLSRTRQKIGRHGEEKTVADLVMGRVSEGFAMLNERDMMHLTFEAVALRHPDRFSDEILNAARGRLAGHGHGGDE